MAVHLDVYDTRDGPWNPEHGDLEIPEDWEFLPAGDAFVTRQVKAAGAWAELAARAHIRHRFTDYHADLDALPVDDLSAGYDTGYRNARARAHAAVDEFLAIHRRGDRDAGRRNGSGIGASGVSDP